MVDRTHGHHEPNHLVPSLQKAAMGKRILVFRNALFGTTLPAAEFDGAHFSR